MSEERGGFEDETALPHRLEMNGVQGPAAWSAHSRP